MGKSLVSCFFLRHSVYSPSFELVCENNDSDFQPHIACGNKLQWKHSQRLQKLQRNVSLGYTVLYVSQRANLNNAKLKYQQQDTAKT